MPSVFVLRRAIRPAGLTVLCFVLLGAGVGCGQQSLNTVPIASSSPTAVPLAAQTPFTATALQSLSAPTAAPGGTSPPIPIALPTNAAVSGSIALPALAGGLPAGAQALTTLTNVFPSGASLPPFSRARIAQDTRAAQSVVITPLLYLDLELSFTATFSEPPGFVFAVAPNQIVPGASYYLALFDSLRPSLGWQLGFEGPAAVSGSTLSFIGNSGPFTIDAFVPYWFGLYAVPASAPTPTPAPSISPLPPPASPTPFPTVAPTASPTPAAPIQISNDHRTSMEASPR